MNALEVASDPHQSLMELHNAVCHPVLHKWCIQSLRVALAAAGTAHYNAQCQRCQSNVKRAFKMLVTNAT
eukprot:4457427-Amphidinium_carterae.2